jgi:hypothetical protein
VSGERRPSPFFNFETNGRKRAKNVRLPVQHPLKNHFGKVKQIILAAFYVVFEK